MALQRCILNQHVLVECGPVALARSSRAQARTTVGREFPISALSMAKQGPSPTIVHVSCALSKTLGRICPASGCGRAQPRQTEYPEDRAEASDVTDADQTVGPQDHLLLKIDTNAQHRDWLIRQSIGLRDACLKWSSPHREHYPGMLRAKVHPGTRGMPL